MNLADNPALYYIFCVVALLVAFLIVRRVASCLIKSVVMIVVAAALAFIYFNYIKVYDEWEKKPEIIQKVDREVQKHIHHSSSQKK